MTDDEHRIVWNNVKFSYFEIMVIRFMIVVLTVMSLLFVHTKIHKEYPGTMEVLEEMAIEFRQEIKR